MSEGKTAIAIAFEAAQLKQKDEAIQKGRPYEDKETEDQVKWRDQATINSAKRKNKGRTKRRLNDLDLSSHRRGRAYRNDETVTVTDNIDRGTTKRVTRTSYGEKALVGYREADKLRRDDSVEWIVLSEIDYATQLTLALPRNQLPRKIVKSGDKVFLDPDTFVDLVEKQEKQNNVKLVISFDRGTTNRRDGSLSVVVANPANPDHHRGSSRDDRDDEWTRRFRSDGSASRKKGV